MSECLNIGDFERLHAAIASEEEKVRIREHLDACGECRRRYTAFASDQRMLAETRPSGSGSDLIRLVNRSRAASPWRNPSDAYGA